MIDILLPATLLGWMGTAAWFDLRTRRIPNVLTFSGVAVALALRAVLGAEPLLAGGLSAAVALVVSLPLFALGALGGGDGKLLMAVGAFLGLERLGLALLATAISGGVLAAVVLVRERAVRSTLLNLHAMLVKREFDRTPPCSSDGVTIPYGVAIAVGAVVGWFFG